MICGIAADLLVNKGSDGKMIGFKGKKFALSFASAAVYLSIMIGVYAVGEHMDDINESLFLDKIITYVFIFFYIGDILKNLKLLLPNSMPIAFLEFFFRLEFVKKIPHLEKFLNKQKSDKDETIS